MFIEIFFYCLIRNQSRENYIEKFAYFGMIGVQLRALLKPLDVRGVSWGPQLVPHDANRRQIFIVVYPVWVRNTFKCSLSFLVT